MIFERTYRLRTLSYDFCEYILAAALIINCRTVWMTLAPGGAICNNLAFILLIGSALGCLVLKERMDLYRIEKAVVAVVVLGAYLAMFVIINHFNAGRLFRAILAFFVLLLYTFICCDREDTPSLLYRYETIILWIAVTSMLLWLAISVLHVVGTSGYAYSTWTPTGAPKTITTFHSIYYEIQKTQSGLIKNTAIFTEAPMSSLHFSIALLIELFGKEKPDWKKLAILTAAVLSTFATTGCIVVLFGLGAKFVLANPNSMIVHVLKAITIPLLMVAAVFVAIQLFQSKMETSSGSIRLDDFVVGLQAWLNKPIFGGGFENLAYIQQFMGRWRSFNTGFSNSPMKVLAECGLYIGLLYVLAGVTGVVRAALHRDTNTLVFIALFLFMFVITVVPYQYLTFFILQWCVSRKFKIAASGVEQG